MYMRYRVIILLFVQHFILMVMSLWLEARIIWLLFLISEEKNKSSLFLHILSWFLIWNLAKMGRSCLVRGMIGLLRLGMVGLTVELEANCSIRQKYPLWTIMKELWEWRWSTENLLYGATEKGKIIMEWMRWRWRHKLNEKFGISLSKHMSLSYY